MVKGLVMVKTEKTDLEPKSPPQFYTVCVRLSPLELHILDALVQEFGGNRSTLIRLMISRFRGESS